MTKDRRKVGWSFVAVHQVDRLSTGWLLRHGSTSSWTLSSVVLSQHHQLQSLHHHHHHHQWRHRNRHRPHHQSSVVVVAPCRPTAGWALVRAGSAVRRRQLAAEVVPSSPVTVDVPRHAPVFPDGPRPVAETQSRTAHLGVYRQWRTVSAVWRGCEVAERQQDVGRDQSVLTARHRTGLQLPAVYDRAVEDELTDEDAVAAADAAGTDTLRHCCKDAASRMTWLLVLSRTSPCPHCSQNSLILQCNTVAKKRPMLDVFAWSSNGYGTGR